MKIKRKHKIWIVFENVPVRISKEPIRIFASQRSARAYRKKLVGHCLTDPFCIEAWPLNP